MTIYEFQRLHVPISEETNQEDDATSQITQADDRDIDTSQTPTQQKQEKRESQQEELRKLQMEVNKNERQSPVVLGSIGRHCSCSRRNETL